METTVMKFSQSHLLFTKDGHTLAIDPGFFDYDPTRGGQYGIEDLPRLDALLLTHTHEDHAHRPIIRQLVQRDRMPIVTNRSLAVDLRTDGIDATALPPGEHAEIGGWFIQGVAQQHGALPPDNRPGPEDLGFLIDRTFYVTGDSIPMPFMPQADVFFVPVAGPQMDFNTARTMATLVHPRVIVPVHYSNVAKFPVTQDEVRSFRIDGMETIFLTAGSSMRWKTSNTAQ